MKKVKIITNGIWLLTLLFLMSSCYKEQHFSFPGAPDDTIKGLDYPFPFSSDKSKGIYLIKDGIVDNKLIGTRGFTDFAFDVPQKTLSWFDSTDLYGSRFFGSRQHKNYYSELNEDNFGNQKFSYECNDIFSRVFVKTGVGYSWYFYTKMSLTSLGHDSRCYFGCLGNKDFEKRLVCGFDDCYWTDMKAQIYFYWNASRVEPFTSGAMGGAYHYKWNFDQFVVDEPFDYELICVNNFVYCRIDGEVIWSCNTDEEPHVREILFRPFSNCVHFFDFYIEGDYETLNMAAWQRENNYATVQSPSLVKAGENLLLFAEGRKENMKQTNTIGALRSNATDIVMKTSADGGNSWSSLDVITGNDGGVYMRPSVVKDETTGKLFLFYSEDMGKDQNDNYRILMKSSTDNGMSWSSAVEIPCNTEDYAPSTISGHGIQMADGTLIMPIQATKSKLGTLATLRSEDGGQTWKLGEMIEGGRNRYPNIVEADGKLIMFIGHDGAGTSRKVTYSTDKGETWSTPEISSINTGNFGHVASGATLKVGNKLIHFTPNNYEKASVYSLASTPYGVHDFPKKVKEMYLYNTPDITYGMTMTESDDNGTTWSEPTDLLPNILPDAYSTFKFRTGNMDAVLWNDNTIVCVCEGGTSVSWEGLVSFKTTLSNQ